MKMTRLFSRGGRQARAAFSLVEVALALGLVAFALVGLLGALPVAAESSRQSIAQTRAGSLANTLFTSFRAQPFAAVQYLDAPFGSSPGATAPAVPTLDLNTQVTDSSDSGKLILYAYFDEIPTFAPADDARRVHFVSSKPKTGPAFLIVLRFNNNPKGTLAPYRLTPGATYHAQASGIEASICDANLVPATHPKDVYHFNSVISNRLD